MKNNKFTELKNGVQEIIDLIASRNAREANLKVAEVREELNELLDFSEKDEDLMEIGRYQVLLEQLQERIIELDGQL